jgi:Short C-terminal domain
MGLLGMVARTAVISGTATAVSNRVSRRQYNRWAGQEQQQYYQEQAPVQAAPAAVAPAAPAADSRDRVEQLKDLADLKAQGILTDEEFAAEKARILAS